MDKREKGGQKTKIGQNIQQKFDKSGNKVHKNKMWTKVAEREREEIKDHKGIKWTKIW